jgi:hypothetical protein
MKINLISVLAVFIAMSSFTHAQVNPGSSAHLTFKGVPIDGTLKEYILKMEKSGFTHLGTEDGVAVLEGEFASFKGCSVFVVSLEQKDLVGKVSVVFPEGVNWSSLSHDYFALKEMLTEKYGEPSEVVEKFDRGEPDDDNSRMHELQMERCKYYTNYETDKGDIQLSIEHSGMYSCSVVLQYYDKINCDIIRAKAVNDL